MPKYFNDERSAPFPQATILLSELTEGALDAAIQAGRGASSVFVHFDDYPQESLGYLFNIQSNACKYKLVNIAGEQELTVSSLSVLLRVIDHSVGRAYHEDIQSVFEKLRNDIGTQGGLEI
jgi:hypothetical protein